MGSRPWQTVSSGAWDRLEHIVTLEGRALVHALRHLLRHSSFRGHRALVLSGSLVCVCSIMKGRYSRPGLARVCRQWCALVLAGDLRVAWRWVPSEVNPADEPSRRSVPIGIWQDGPRVQDRGGAARGGKGGGMR